MKAATPAYFPATLRSFWSRAEPVLRADPRLLGVLAAGSAISGEMDVYSDLDLILVVRDTAYAEIMASHVDYPARIPGLLSAFVGHHVGEPRLVIALFADPLVHIDFKFVTPDALARRIETPIVLIDETGDLGKLLAAGTASWPNQEPQWFEDRIWVWFHYGAVKIARGELFEALNFLADIRRMVLGPLAARRKGRDQNAIRRIETIDPDFASRLQATASLYDSEQAWSALFAAIDLYLELRADKPPSIIHASAEQAVRTWIAEERKARR
ncbi:MAG: nucleotidyltransferase domain-containing protein [Alphaproteobacteria bacterium]|nr:nucleotidyltransferase domain-containing protein [Alphaproteobacteria bacterium]